MKENRTNATIAITTIIGSVLMVLALSLAIGKWSLGGSHYDLVIKFPNATGINPNSDVKYAGAKIGRVKSVRLIPRKDQTQDSLTRQFNCVEVVAEVNRDIEIGEDVSASIKQDGIGISAKYVLLTPGPDHNSKALTDGSVLQGDMPFQVADLAQPAGDVLAQAKSILSTLQPVVTRLDSISEKLDPMVTHADRFLQDGDSVMANLSTPESRERINTLLASLRVTSENLKVVTSNAKALTATLADKPWRVFWGGPTIKAPTESDVLQSDQVVPLKPEVDVNAAQSSNTANTSAKKKAGPAPLKPVTQLN